ncbi:MAG: hypothetical protein BWK73_05405 [Thiothrix lacustris]|uniref:MurNAc-LAA domain-containing protein n=1 Tax=Thiothrix lacustris TaxID=525917 RepID=A0A1Y1QXB4_9GAMM|nr:MAG: hypothetical protein BWK73_05405 [Thiothrix lacustris]
MSDDVLNKEMLDYQLMKAEEYENTLDILHPEDVIKQEKAFLFRSSKLALVVGHSARSPGAKGCPPISRHEYHWNQFLAKIIKDIATAKGINCEIFYRDGIGILGAYQEVNDWKADACVELHFNAYNGQVVGSEVLYGSSNIFSKKLAEDFQEMLVRVYSREGVANRGIKHCKAGVDRGGENVNQLVNIPSCLIEPYFGDAQSDAKKAKKYINVLADSIIAVYLNFIKKA